MKNILLAGSAVAALAATPVLAADMPVKAPPVAAPVYNWTGCYVGTNVGAKWGQSRHFSALPNTAGGVLFPAGTNITSKPHIDMSGYLAGGQAGCQFHGGNFVIGIEGDGALARVRGEGEEILPWQLVPSPGSNFNTFALTEERWLATARARIGFTFSNNRGLLYATGGGAWAGVRASELNAGSDPLAVHVTSQTKTLAGWTAGGGLEWVLTGPWTGKVEYLYVELHKSLFFQGDPDPFLPRYVDARQHIVRFGLNYRFIPY